MRDRLKIVIPGNPGDGSINRAYKPAVISVGKGRDRKHHPTMLKTAKGKAFEQRVVLFGRSDKNANPEAAAIVRAAPKLQAIVTAYWPTRRHLEGTTDLANGDADSPLKGTLDPLQDWFGKGKAKKPGAGVFDDDSRIVRVTGVKVYDVHDKDNPRIEIEIWPYDGDAA